MAPLSQAMEPNNAVTDPVAFGRQALQQWGYPDIGVATDDSSLGSWAGPNGIHLGTEWQTFDKDPEILKAILGHELMHIIHEDARINWISGVALYSIYRAATAFYANQALKALVDFFFPSNDWSISLTNWLLKNLLLIIVPMITLYRSSATIFPHAKAPFIMQDWPWSKTIFSAIYLFLTVFGTSDYDAAMTSIRSALHSVFSLCGSAVQELFSLSSEILFPVIAYFILRYGSLLVQRAVLRNHEYVADRESALQFHTKQSWIVYLKYLQDNFPEENIFSLTRSHPTPAQRIEALQAIINH